MKPAPERCRLLGATLLGLTACLLPIALRAQSPEPPPALAEPAPERDVPSPPPLLEDSGAADEPAPEAPDTPPLSTYDRLRQENDEPLEEERSLTSQLIRTVFALAIVVGLIYLVFKLGLGKLLQGAGGMGLAPRGSREVKVLERTMLDGKNAVIMLQLGGDRRILVGAGERGVSYLCEVDPSANGHPRRGHAARDDAEDGSSRTFDEVLDANAKEKHEA